jgi:hypothetical protein
MNHADAHGELITKHPSLTSFVFALLQENKFVEEDLEPNKIQFDSCTDLPEHVKRFEQRLKQPRPTDKTVCLPLANPHFFLKNTSYMIFYPRHVVQQI